MFTPSRFQRHGRSRRHGCFRRRDGALQSLRACLLSVLAALACWPSPPPGRAAARQAGGVVQFTQTVYLADEGVGGVLLTVTRTGDTSGVVSVDYATVDNPAAVRCDDTTTLPGVAFARCDYATWLDTLTFAAGETTKTIRVPVINDAHVEPQESFEVRLSNLRGDAAFGALASTRVTVSNNDAPGQPNPIDSAPFFVRQHYLDFLSREPEPAGQQAWVSVLANCAPGDASCDRVQVSLSFLGAPEFQLKGSYVFRFYRAAFDRLPEYTEIVADMRRVSGQTPAEVFQKRADYANAFVRRAEFVTRYAGLGNEAYVAALLSRYGLTQVTTPDPAAPDGTNKVVLTAAQLAGRLNASTLTRAQVLRAVVQSDEVSRAEFDRTFVAMQYYGYLRRTPDEAGFQSWISFLADNPGDYRTMVRGFLDSAEYRLRFGTN